MAVNDKPYFAKTRQSIYGGYYVEIVKESRESDVLYSYYFGPRNVPLWVESRKARKLVKLHNAGKLGVIRG